MGRACVRTSNTREHRTRTRTTHLSEEKNGAFFIRFVFVVSSLFSKHTPTFFAKHTTQHNMSTPKRSRLRTRRASINHLKSLVAHHVPANSPTTPHDLHIHHAGSPGSDDGYSDVASNGSLTDVGGSPSSSRPNSPPHHHHHHHSANETALLAAFQTDQEQKIAIIARGLSHFSNGFLTKGFKKWQEYIQLQIWSNLAKKAKNICRGTKTLGGLSKTNRKAVTEWVDTICTEIFKNLSKEEKRELVDGSMYHEVLEGQPLFYQGDRGKHYWIVLTGQIRITVFESNNQAIRKSKLYKRR